MYKGVDVFLFASSGILAYRVFRNDRKLYIKILHASMHVAALIFASVGLKAVFDSHNNSGNANLYSLHSWLGLTVVIAFGLQVCLHHKILNSFCGKIKQMYLFSLIIISYQIQPTERFNKGILVYISKDYLCTGLWFWTSAPS